LGRADRQRHHLGLQPYLRCDAGSPVRRRPQGRLRRLQSSRQGPPRRWRMDRQWRMARSEEHTSELQSLMRISYAVFCLKKKINTITNNTRTTPKKELQT